MQYSAWEPDPPGLEHPRGKPARIVLLAYLLLVLGGGLVLAGCEGSSPLVASPESKLRERAAPDPGAEQSWPVPAASEPIGDFRFTMYFVAVEPKADPDEVMQASAAPVLAQGASIPAMAASDTVALYDRKTCKAIARVDRDYAQILSIQGTGKLRDGRIVNSAGACRCPRSPCWAEVESAWGIGPVGRLTPFRSVAVDTKLIKLGTLLYVPELDGVRMPGKAPLGGFVHDGCVIADDRGGGIGGKEIDFFVGKKAYLQSLDVRHRLKRVTVYPGKGRCERKGGRVRKISS